MTATPTIDLTRPYKTRVHDALENRHLKTALDRATARLSGARVAAMDARRQRCSCATRCAR